jgi:peptidoglycan-N-acetylglucosamine deacetylase
VGFSRASSYFRFTNSVAFWFNSAVHFRPTLLSWLITVSPFVTLLIMASGWIEGLIIFFLAHVLFFLVMFIPSLQGFGPVITRFKSDDRAVWLTIDDGPDPLTTPGILELLERYKAKATFFLIGEKIEKYPELTRSIVEAGHTIGNHTQSHPIRKFWRLHPAQLAREIDSFEETMVDLGLKTPALFRAPAGIKSPFLHPLLAVRCLHLVAWTCRAYDTRLDDPKKIVRRIKRSVSSGSIILFHESQRPTVCLEALDLLLTELSAERFRCIIPRPSEFISGRRAIRFETA